MKSHATAVCLISCVSRKRHHVCHAQELYISDWFLKARRYAEASGCRWFILSAEYGLVAPDRVIAPYERTLNTMPIAERRAWAERVSEQLATAVPELSQVVFLAGERYREFLARYLTDRGVTVFVPMKGVADWGTAQLVGTAYIAALRIAMRPKGVQAAAGSRNVAQTVSSQQRSLDNLLVRFSHSRDRLLPP